MDVRPSADVLHLAAKRWFEVIDGGDPEIFDRLPPKMQAEYCHKVLEALGPVTFPYFGDPKQTYLFGRPLGE